MRALAVLAVLAFHARLPVPGGFVGVDVFFVISGFVITSMLQREWQKTGGVALGSFYERRFRRLTPALAVMVAVTVIGGAIWLSPFGPQQVLAKTAAGALALSANFVIAKTTGGYFDLPAATNPLLHTWSLAVEEQFYLFYPLFIAACWKAEARWPRRRFTLLVPLGTAVSLLLALWAWKHPLGPKRTWLLGFYGPAGRAWELGSGAVLFLFARPLARLELRTATRLGLAGLVLVGAAFAFMSEATPVPGPWMLLPVAGTLLLLAAGYASENPVSRLLAAQPLVRIGDWSYSLYLWHWPLIVFAASFWPDRRWMPALAALVSVVPALGSYRWVETPLRVRRTSAGPRLALVVLAILVPPAVMSGGLLYAANHIWGPRLSAADATTAFRGEVAWKDHDYRQGGYAHCADAHLRDLFEKSPNGEPRCQQSKAGPKVDIALLGDSHAEHIFIGLLEALPATNLMYFTVNGSPTLADPNFAAAVDYAVKTPSIHTVLVTAYWAGRGVDAPSLTQVLKTLVAANKRVFLTDDVPALMLDPFACKVRRGPCSRTLAECRPALASIDEQLLKVAAAVPGVRLLETAGFLCNAEACSMTFGQDIFYADPSHLNVLGSRFVGRRLVAAYGSALN